MVDENAKREIRFLVPQNYYDRVKGYADECGESVASFVRQVVYDRLAVLDSVSLSKKAPDMMKMMETMVSMSSGDAEKMTPVLLELMEMLSSDSGGSAVKVPRTCGTSEE